MFTFYRVGLDLCSSERKRLSHVLASMHVAITDQQISKSCVNNWTYKNFVERYCVTLLWSVSCILYAHRITSSCTYWLFLSMSS